MTESEWLTCEDPVAMLRYLTDRPQQVASGHRRNPHHPGDRKLRLFACACCRYEWGLMKPVCRTAIATAEELADGNTTQGAMYDASESVRNLLNSEYEPTITGDRNRYLALAAFLVASQTHRQNVAECAQTSLGYLCRAFPEAHSRFAPLLRDIIGNPFRPVESPRSKACQCSNGWRDELGYSRQDVCPRCWGTRKFTAPWLTPTVLSLAQAAYEERQADGTIDPIRLMILADALEEAGCDDEIILDHLRGLYGCDLCEGVMVIYETEALTSRRQCPKCSGDGLLPPPPHFRGCWAVDLVLGKE